MGHNGYKEDKELGRENTSWVSLGVTSNLFTRYTPEDVPVSLTIAGELLDISSVKENQIRGNVIALQISPSQVPDVLLSGVPRDAFVAKFCARLGSTWGCTFVQQADGSYAADEIFLDNVADIVRRARKS